MAEIETLMLANQAEAHDGLLYVMGGGWTDVQRQIPLGQQPPAIHFGIAIAVLVGWTETNRPHSMLVLVEPEDGGESLLRVETTIEIGRPPGIVEGADQRAAMALNGELLFPSAGGYRLVAQLDDAVRTASFRVRDVEVPSV